MNALDRLIFRPISTARPYLMAKGVLLLLGLDCIVELVSHGGRYGVGGFNVAHFALLDAVLPVPTPALYVGTLFACSLLAFVLVLGQLRRSLLIALITLYTLAWASSLLDAYQHHYLLSLLLASMCAFPETKLRDLVRPVVAETSAPPAPHRTKGRRHSETTSDEPLPAEDAHPLETREGPGYVSFLFTCAIVYAFTALMKLDPDWRSGAALARIVDTSTLYPLMIAFGRLGLSEAEWYLWLARGAIAIQAVCSATFVLAAFSDAFATRRARGLVSLLLVAPIAFHVSAEAMDLEIGWFSRYMMLIACVALLPDSVIRLPLQLVGALRGLTRPADAKVDAPGEERFARFVFAALAAVLVPVVLSSVDLPGTLGAGIFAAVFVLGVFAHEERAGKDTADDLPIALAIAGLLAFGCVSYPRLGLRAGDTYYGVEASTVRYDYYRYVAGDFVRREDTASALANYRKALEFAPNDELREATRGKIERLAHPR